MKVIKKGNPGSLAGGTRLTEDVNKIIMDVRAGGDLALASYNRKFGGSTRENFRVSYSEIEAAYDQLTQAEIDEMKTAASNIQAFAEAQKECLSELKDFQVDQGIYLNHRVIPVRAAMTYVPGGNYPLFSTALMLGIPAKVAGVPRVVACSPEMKGKGVIHPKTLVAMDIAGVDEIYAMGGSQAVAAMAYGTESIKPVDLIVGPGNSYVTEAKKQCYGQIGIDFPAGPSEVMILADAGADVRMIAADLLAQAEHDMVAKAILITLDEEIALDAEREVKRQLALLKTREIAEKSWNEYGEILFTEDMDEAIRHINEYAPEHLEICIKSPEKIVDELYNYGSLFLGQNTAEVFGDYVSGTNHTLPTLGAAKFTGGVWVGTFLKVQTHQMMTREGAARISPIAANMADGEGLMAHKQAALLRGKDTKRI